MFTARERDQLLSDLVAHAQTDPAVTAAALVGSAARGDTDPWSDIDLALRLAIDEEPAGVAATWTALLAERSPVAHHLDIWSGSVLYRVVLLRNGLQVDLSFWPGEEFASTGEPFRLLFGAANPPRNAAEPEVDFLVGWAWLYALHARSALARGRYWQAVQMLDGLRDQVVALACRRHQLPGHQGRGVDRLPPALLTSVAGTLVSRPDADQLGPAFASAVALLLDEVDLVDPALASRLRVPLDTTVERTPAVSPDPASRPPRADAAAGDRARG